MADIQSNIKVNIDTSNALEQIKLLQSEISAFHTQMAKGGAQAAAQAAQLRQSLLNGINATGKFSAQMTTVKTSTEYFTQALEKNKLTMGEYFRYAGGASKTFGKLFKSEFDTITKVARERVKDLQTQYIKMGRDANGAMQAIKVRPLMLDMDNLATKTAIAAQKQQLLNQLLKQGSTNLLNFGKNTQWAGRQLMVGFTVPLAMLGSVAIKSFKEMEEAVVKFKRVYGDLSTGSEETNKMASDIKKLAESFTQYGIAVKDTMDMAATAAATGKMGAELVAQVNSATKLAVLGGIDQQKALQTTISLTNAFGISAEDLTKKINFLNAVENQTVLSIDDLTTAIPKAAPVVKQLGGSVEDLAFFLTAMKEGGINASEGANALKSGLASLINPTAKASAFLQSFGINVKGIVESDKGNLKKTVVDFASALNTLDPLNRARAIEQMFGKFQFSRLSTLFQNVIAEGSQAQKALELSNATSEELAILSERELKKVSDSPLYKYQKAMKDFQNSMVPIGEQFLKSLTPILNFVNGVLKNFNDLGDGTKSFVVGFTAILAGVGPVVLMVVGLIANGVANLIKLFANFKSFFNGLGKSSKDLGSSTKYMTSEQIEAASVAASLDQVHGKLTQTFTAEAEAIQSLVGEYQKAIAAQEIFRGTSMPAGTMTRKYASGGIISGPGTGTSDSIVARVSNGEAVIPAKSVAKNPELVKGLISGNVPKYANGMMPVYSGGGFVMPPRMWQREIGPQTQAAALASEKKALALQAMHDEVMSSEYASMQALKLPKQLVPSGGNSFITPRIGGIYQLESGEQVFIKPQPNLVSALAELRGTKIAREAHGLIAPEQKLRVIFDPTDPEGKRKLFALESPLNEKVANPSSTFTKKEYFKQLTASLLRGDKDLQAANLGGSVLADVGPSGVFARATRNTEMTTAIPSMEEQAMINLLGVKGGAKKWFAQATSGIAKEMTPVEYHNAMLEEINSVLPKLKATVANMSLTNAERPYYEAMVARLEAGRGVDWSKFQQVHAAVPGFAKGMISGPGTGTSDSILARVSNGEAIIPAKSVAKNPQLVRQLISGNVPGFNGGGEVLPTVSNLTKDYTQSGSMWTNASHVSGFTPSQLGQTIEELVAVNEEFANTRIELTNFIPVLDEFGKQVQIDGKAAMTSTQEMTTFGDAVAQGKLKGKHGIISGQAYGGTTVLESATRNRSVYQALGIEAAPFTLQEVKAAGELAAEGLTKISGKSDEFYAQLQILVNEGKIAATALESEAAVIADYNYSTEVASRAITKAVLADKSIPLKERNGIAEAKAAEVLAASEQHFASLLAQGISEEEALILAQKELRAQMLMNGRMLSDSAIKLITFEEGQARDLGRKAGQFGTNAIKSGASVKYVGEPIVANRGGNASNITALKVTAGVESGLTRLQAETDAVLINMEQKIASLVERYRQAGFANAEAYLKATNAVLSGPQNDMAMIARNRNSPHETAGPDGTSDGVTYSDNRATALQEGQLVQNANSKKHAAASAEAAAAAGAAEGTAHAEARIAAAEVENAELTVLAKQQAEKDKAIKAEKSAGRKMGAMMALSMLPMAASAIPGSVGKAAQDNMMPLMMASMLPMFGLKWGSIIAAIALVVTSIMSYMSAVNEARDKQIALSMAVGTSAQAILDLSKAAGNVTAGEIMDRRRTEKMNILSVKPGQNTFGESFINSDAGKALIGSVKENVAQNGNSITAADLARQMTLAVTSGAMSMAQAKSVVANIATSLGDRALGIKVIGTMTELLGPNGENLTKNGLSLKVRLQMINEEKSTRKDMQRVAKKANQWTGADAGNALGWTAGGAAAGAAAGGVVGSILGAPVAEGFGAIPAIAAGIGGLAGGIAGFFQGMKDRDARIAKFGAALSAMDKNTLDQNKQILDSFDLEYQKKHDLLIQQGKINEAVQLENTYYAQRETLLKATKANKQLILDNYMNNRTNDSGIAGQYNTGVEKQINKVYKDTNFSEMSNAAIDSINNSGLLDERKKMSLKLSLEDQTLNPEQILTLMNMFTTQKQMDAFLNIDTKFGSTVASQAMQVMGSFTDVNGKPLTSLQNQFMLTLDAQTTSKKADDLLNVFTTLTSFSNVIPAEISVSVFEKNLGKASSLQNIIEQINDSKGTIKLDFATKILGGDKVSHFMTQADLFNKLSDQGKKTFVAAYATELLLQGDPTQMEAFKLWQKQQPGKSPTDYFTFAGQNANKIAQNAQDLSINLGGDPPPPPEAPQASFLDQIVKGYRNAFNWQQKLSTGFKDSKNVIDKFVVKGFNGLAMQLARAGVGPEAISAILDAPQSEIDQIVDKTTGKIKTSFLKTLPKITAALNPFSLANITTRWLGMTKDDKLQEHINMAQAGLEVIKIKEDKINKKYDERVKSLDEIKTINEEISQSQQDQLDLATALSSGDSASAAKAMQKMQYDNAQAQLDATKKSLENARQSEIANVKVTDENGNLVTREDLENRIAGWSEKIATHKYNQLKHEIKIGEQLDEQIKKYKIIGGGSVPVASTGSTNNQNTPTAPPSFDVPKGIPRIFDKPKPAGKDAKSEPSVWDNIMGSIQAIFKGTWEAIFAPIVDAVASWFQKNVIDPIVAQWNVFAGWFDVHIIKPVKDAWNVFAKWFDVHIIKPIRDAWNNFVGWFDKNIVKPVQNLFSWFTSNKSMEDKAKDVKKWWADVGAWFQALPGNIAKWFADTGNNIAGWFSGKVDEIKNWFASLAGQVADGASTFWNDTLPSIGDWFTAKGNEFVTWVQSIPGTVSAATTDFFTNLFPSIGAWFTAKGNEFLAWVKTLPATISTGVTNFFNGIFPGFGDWLSARVTEFTTWLTVTLPASVTTGAKALWNTLPTIGDWLSARVTEFTTWLTKTLPASIAAGATALWNTLPAIGTWFTDRATEFTTWLTKTLPASITAGATKLWDSLPAIGTWLGNLIPSFTTWLTTTLPAGIKGVTTSIWDSLPSIGTWLGSLIPTFTTWLTKTLPASITAGATKLWDSLPAIGDWLTEKANAFVTWVKNLPDKLSKSVGDFWGSIFPAIGDWLTSASVAFGKWILGIPDMVKTAIKKAVKSAPDPIRIFLETTLGWAFAKGGLVPGYAKGGMIPGYALGGTAMGTDTIPAMLTPGEFVIKKSSVDRIGIGTLNKMNSGGMVDGTQTNSADCVYNTYSVNINVMSDSNPNDIANTVMREIRRIDDKKMRSNRV
jgi:TP901 family phage tail tape measure protein